jgi:hypothetical protein
METIKPHELRIGNYLLRNGIVVRIDSISISNIEFHRSVALEYWPVDLTPEWLTRFGFKRTQVYENVDEWFHNPLNIQTDGEIFMVTRIGIYDLELKSVHQLQNLYFALTGQELMII